MSSKRKFLMITAAIVMFMFIAVQVVEAERRRRLAQAATRKKVNYHLTIKNMTYTTIDIMIDSYQLYKYANTTNYKTQNVAKEFKNVAAGATVSFHCTDRYQSVYDSTRFEVSYLKHPRTRNWYRDLAIHESSDLTRSHSLTVR